MRRRALNEGTREEILKELDEAGLSRTFGAMLHGGTMEKPERIGEAYRQIRDGETWVELDHNVYHVVEVADADAVEE